MLLIEVSCTEICAYTLCNTCTVIFQAVLGLLHICCKNSLTTCSKPNALRCSVCAQGPLVWDFWVPTWSKSSSSMQTKCAERGMKWVGASRGKAALPWWDLLLISIRRWNDLISRNICLLTSDYPHVPSNIQNTALRWGHGPLRGTRDWQCQFHRLLVNNTICWMDHCLERDGRTWQLTMTCKTYFHTYLWIQKGPCIKKCFGKVVPYPPQPINFPNAGY